jgi:uncharacterized membrane-anchored protein YitT (DUF2179 family)
MNKKTVDKVIEALMINVGIILIALGLIWFLEPNTIAPGGVTGLAIVIERLTGVPIYITNLIINVPLFILGIVVLGKGAGVKTAYGTLGLSGFLVLLTNVEFTNSPATADPLLASIFGGVIVGIGIGLLFKVGGSTGGTDLAGAILNKFFPSLSAAKLMMFVDICVIVLAGVVSGKVETALYSSFCLYIMVKAADFIVEDLNYSKSFYIISRKSEEISERIIKELERGVTALQGRGMYSGEEKDILMCVVNRAQVQKVKNIVREIDPEAFVMLNTTHEVLGEGFQLNK